MNVFLWCVVGLNNIAQPTLAVVSLATLDNMKGGAHGHSIRSRVLIDDEDYCVSPKRKIQQEFHQPKLRERNQKEKMKHSTIREKEWHQPKFSERVQK